MYGSEILNLKSILYDIFKKAGSIDPAFFIMV
jgi:hypothetical protein